jgi:hypothetical protein
MCHEPTWLVVEDDVDGHASLRRSCCPDLRENEVIAFYMLGVATRSFDDAEIELAGPT